MEELKRQTRQLDHDVVALTREVTRLNRRNRWVLAALAILATALLAVIVFVGYRVERTGREQNQIRSEVLCPLYGLVLGGYDPDSREAGADRDKYEKAFDVFRDGYRVLDCRPDQIVPPRTDQ